MTLYAAFVLLTLTVLAMPIGYGEWKRNRTVNEGISSDHSHSETEPHAETEPMRRAA
jgi:hypothetical protein